MFLPSPRARRLIKISFEESKNLYLSRFFSILFFSAIISIVYYFVRYTEVLYLGLAAIVCSDLYLVKFRQKFAIDKNESFFSSTLPLSNEDLFYIRFVDSLIANIILYPVLILGALLMFADGLNLLQTVLAYIFFLSHAFIYSAFFKNYAITDRDLRHKQPTFKELTLKFSYALLVIITVTAFLSSFLFFETQFKLVDNIFDYFNIFSILVLVDSFSIMAYFLAPKYDSEHKKHRRAKMSWKQKFVHLSKYTAASLITVIVCGVFISFKSKTSRHFALFNYKNLNYKNEFLDTVFSGDLDKFSNEYNKLSDSHEISWMTKKGILRIVIAENKISHLKNILGEDIKDWDKNYCLEASVKKKDCKKNIILSLARYENSKKLVHFLISNPSYEMSKKSAEKTLVVYSKKCNKLIVNSLLKSGTDPLIPTLKNREKFFASLHKDENDCKKILSSRIYKL